MEMKVMTMKMPAIREISPSTGPEVCRDRPAPGAGAWASRRRSALRGRNRCAPRRRTPDGPVAYRRPSARAEQLGAHLGLEHLAQARARELRPQLDALGCLHAADPVF